jgi:hypothetical protein
VASDNDPYTKATKNYETNLTEPKESSSYYFVYNIANKTCDLSGCIKDENTLKDLPTKVSYLGFDFSVTGIYDFAFYGSILETIELPDTYSKIGQYAFSNSKIKNIDLKNITSLNQYAFSDCQNLTNIVLAESIVTYGMNTFYNDKNLTSVKILGKASSISQNMFKGCTNLNTIYISKDVSKIMTDAFADTALKTINFEGTKEEWKNILSNSGDNISKYFNETIDLNINYSIAK